MRNEPNRRVGNREENAGTARRSSDEVEQIVVLERMYLYNRGLPCGAAALRQHLRVHDGVQPLPSVRQIGQVLTRYGLTHGRTGWYENEEPDWLPASARVSQAQRKSLLRFEKCDV